MKTTKRILLLFCILTLVSALCPAQVIAVENLTDDRSGHHEFSYTNPVTRDTAISMRDHFIIKVGNSWYCTGTSNPVWTGHNPGVRLLVSDDLLNWRQHSWLIDAASLQADCPYNGRFWAPEIHWIQGKYWLTVNSGKVTEEDPKGMSTHSIWLFVSDSVTGPYSLVNGPLTPQYNNDATLFEDSEDPYCETGHNALFEGPDGRLWSSCHYLMYDKRPYPYCSDLQSWEKRPQLGIEPVIYQNGTFSISGPTWTEQIVEY